MKITNLLKIFNKDKLLDYKKLNYSLIAGSANSGKTGYFLDNNEIKDEKLIVSVVGLKYIYPPGRDSKKDQFRFINLRAGDNDFQIDSYQPKSSVLLLIDEFHFFKRDDIILLNKLLKKIDLTQSTIFFSILLQSHSNKFLDHTKKLIENTDDFILIKSNCIYCKKSTVQSKCNFELKQELYCDKSKFSTVCKICKLNPKVNLI